jgi:hypothetical protein
VRRSHDKATIEEKINEARRGEEWEITRNHLKEVKLRLEQAAAARPSPLTADDAVRHRSSSRCPNGRESELREKGFAAYMHGMQEAGGGDRGGGADAAGKQVGGGDDAALETDRTVLTDRASRPEQFYLQDRLTDV